MVFINKKRHINYRLRIYVGSSKGKREGLENIIIYSGFESQNSVSFKNNFSKRRLQEITTWRSIKMETVSFCFLIFSLNLGGFSLYYAHYCPACQDDYPKECA